MPTDQNPESFIERPGDIIKKALVIENIGGSISDGLHYVHLIVQGTVIKRDLR